MQFDKNKIPGDVVCFKRREGRCDGYLVLCHHVFNDLPQVDVDTCIGMEAEVHFDKEHCAGYEFGNVIFQAMGRVAAFDMYKPVMVSSLGMSIDDGVQQFVLELARVGTARKVDNIGCKHRDCGILMYVVNDWQFIGGINVLDIP
mgnify:CR=1 FL=1